MAWVDVTRFEEESPEGDKKKGMQRDFENKLRGEVKFHAAHREGWDSTLYICVCVGGGHDPATTTAE